jgi:predicted RNA binding protein YcfA (HicA-like mRNA interferase family)
MRLPGDLSGADVVKALRRVGYVTIRQTGHPIRMATNDGQRHVTVPNHNPIKIGTLSGMLSDVAAYLEISRRELAEKLF